MQQSEILPSRSELLQKKLLEYCGVGFAAATASALFFPMPPVVTLLDSIEMAASVGMLSAAVYIELKVNGMPKLFSAKKLRGAFASFAPSIAYPRTATSQQRPAVKPTADNGAQETEQEIADIKRRLIVLESRLARLTRGAKNG